MSQIPGAAFARRIRWKIDDKKRQKQDETRDFTRRVTQRIRHFGSVYVIFDVYFTLGNMGLIRRSFSKHYCPACGGKVCRARPTVGESLLESAVIATPLMVIWALVSSSTEHFGVPHIAVSVMAGLTAWVSLNPLFFCLSAFECTACHGRYKHNEVICRGWGIVT